MKISTLNQPLGMGNSFAPQRKEWVVAAIGAATGLASSFLGGLSASAAAREAARLQREQKARDDAWYNRRYNESYLDTDAGQNLVRRVKRFYDESVRKSRGHEAMMGGTGAETAQTKESAMKAMGDTVANIAAADVQRKDNVDNLHRQDEQRYTQSQVNLENQRAANITNAAQAASNALINAGAAIEQANTRGVNLTGGSNNGGSGANVDMNDVSGRGWRMRG